jgi:hypothetical protein
VGVHEITPANKAKRVENVRTLLQALKSHLEKQFTQNLTGDEG